MKQFLLFVCLLSTILTFAQQDKKSDAVRGDLSKKTDAKTEGWTHGGLLNIGINQGILENWSAGGERMSFAGNGQFNGFMTRIKGNTLFENTIDLYYGLNYVASNDFIPRKLDDRIDLSTRYGVQPKSWRDSTKKFKYHTYFMGLLRFQSQFTEGYEYEIGEWQLHPKSEFLSPAYITLALGAEYRPNDHFSIFLSPLAGRFTTVKSKYTMLSSAFGVEEGETARFELGAYMTTKYKTQLTKNILFNSRLDLYSNYLAKNKNMPEGYIRKDNPGNIDILWDNFFAMKISKFIGAGLGFTMIYDNDIPGQKTKNNNTAYGPLGWWQLKEVLNIGFSYKIK